MKTNSIYLKLARKIASDERDGIERRYEYGAELLKARSGRQRLPKGFLADRIAENDRAGLPKISEGELQRYMRLAEVYPTKAHRRHAMTLIGSWFEIVRQNFPEVIVDEDLIEPEDLEVPAPDEFEQLSLLPGFKETVKVHGREMPIGEATVPDLIAYREKYRSMHEGFGKTLALIEATVDAILDGWDGDPETKAVDAYHRSAST